ncbi:MAG: aminotransferase class V-fold PLP-dependent enzyme [Candidatus Shikimatogenerans sp. AspAUS03]|uniref:Aminotransferase class V-fold PLP-dependent enzyme n=1 Tax=Candidatus Shikimatogenerans sp. AspAUS03 TaxID=3158563 RepID=A0AAU7QV49_9FLAO
MFKNIKNQFPFFKKNPKIIYLDNASTTQKLNSVIKNITYIYKKYYSNCRSNHKFANKIEYLIYKTKYIIKNFINAKYLEEIFFTQNTTESLNIISKCLNFKLLKNIKCNKFLISFYEHNSNYLPWINFTKKFNLKLEYLPLNKKGFIDFLKLKQIIKKVKIISISYISNVFGIKLNIKKISKLCKKFNIILILDCAQSIGDLKVNVQKYKIDFLVFSMHKIYGPEGVGILYCKKKILKIMNKYNLGGGSINSIINYKKHIVDYKSNFLGFEYGTRNNVNIISSYKVFKFIYKYKLSNIQKYKFNLLKFCEYKLKQITNIKIYFEKIKKYSIISFNILNISCFDINFFLNQYNVFIRSGYHCSHLYFKKYNIKNGTIRLSFSIYNTIIDIIKFIKILKFILNKFFKKFI